MDPKIVTADTYIRNSKALSEKYDKSGIRIEDIDYIFDLRNKENPFVFEIGYGNGRDAVYFHTRTNLYTGIDISEPFARIAKERAPTFDFKIADVEEYQFPKDIDIVYSSGSLLHVPKESLQRILQRLYPCITPGGIVFISLKAANEYKQVMQHDQYGTRAFWHYSKQDMEDVASGFKIKSITESKLGEQDWMEVTYIKK